MSCDSCRLPLNSEVQLSALEQMTTTLATIELHNGVEPIRSVA